MEAGVIAIVFILILIVVFATWSSTTKSNELPAYKPLKFPCDENQRLILLSHLEGHRIAYREVSRADFYRTVANECFILVPETDYERAASIVRDLLGE